MFDPFLLFLRVVLETCVGKDVRGCPCEDITVHVGAPQGSKSRLGEADPSQPSRAESRARK